MWNRGKNGLRIAAAKNFHLSALHHFAQQRHIVRMMLEQKFQQPATEMHRKTKLRILIQCMNERPVTPGVGIVNHLGKITHRLMGVDAKQKLNRRLHEFYLGKL